MQQLQISEIARAIGCANAPPGAIDRIVTDSRAAEPGALFIAFCGERVDGNDFVPQALQQGAAAAVAERLVSGADASRVMLVPDAKRAMIQIGGLYRDRFELPIVGVTGSVGKTTTKEFIYAVLSKRYCTHKNEGNQNNELGVPNTLFALEPTHRAAVIEMGMSGPGEIRDLARAVRPSVGVITSVGVSHIERLGTRENILKAKLELLEGLPAGAPIFLCGDNDLLSQVQDDRFKLIFYGITNPNCPLRAENSTTVSGETRFEIVSPWGAYSAVIPTVGQHNVLDALAAFGVGCVMGVPPSDAAAALADFRPTGMRQKIVPWRGATVVEDCYNSSPDSLRAAALTLAAYPCKGRRMLVLSDMLELGDRAAALHRECGTFIARQGIDLLFCCGTLSQGLIEGADAAGMERCVHFSTKEKMADALRDTVRSGDVVWFKASRGMALEEAIARMYKGGEGA